MAVLAIEESFELLEGESLKTCTRCKQVGVASPDRVRSDFSRRRDGYYRSNCHDCKRAQERERRKGHAEERAKRTWEKAAKARAAKARKREQVKAEKIREQEKWEAFPALNPTPRRSDHSLKVAKSKVKLPGAPTGAWLRYLWSQIAAEHGGIREFGNPDENNLDRVTGQLADMVGLSSKHVYAYAKGTKKIDYSTVDRMASNEGKWTVEQIYWQFGRIRLEAGEKGDGGGFEVLRWEPKKKEVPVTVTEPRRCATPRNDYSHCETHAIEGRRFCQPCLDRIAPAKAAYEKKARDFIESKGKSNAMPTCCVKGCYEFRFGTNRFCDEHMKTCAEEDLYE